MIYDGIVIGGGPAGMFAAITAARQGARVMMLEKNDRLGRKLLITGKGRCNVTNDCSAQEVLQNVPRNGRFLYSAMAAFPPEKTMAFFRELGCNLKTERGNRVFPVSDRAADIIDALLAYADDCANDREILQSMERVDQDTVNDLVLRETKLNKLAAWLQHVQEENE